MNQDTLCLGIDIGTTAIKACIIEANSKKVLSSESLAHNAYIKTSDLCYREQNVTQLIRTVRQLLQKLPCPLMTSIQSIGVCGQMHGILWWNGEQMKPSVILSCLDGQINDQTPWSNLITWEDTRFSSDNSLQFAKKLESINSSPLRDGYGVASFAHAIKNDPSVLDGYTTCGTIQDFIVFVLCGFLSSSCSTMDRTNAYSFGAFNIDSMEWNNSTLERLNIPCEMLPPIKEAGTIVGVTDEISSRIFSLPQGVEVAVAMGDHQCSVLASLLHIKGTSTSPNAFVNIGTSAQLSILVPARDVGFKFSSVCTPENGIELRPFFQNCSLLSAAALTGGNAFAHFVDMISKSMFDLGVQEVATDELYEKLIKLGMDHSTTSLSVKPILFGERRNVHERGQIQNLCLGNWTIGDLSAAFCRGIVENLFQMLPDNATKISGVKRVVGTGNALIKNRLLQHYVEDISGLPLELSSNTDSDAAFGAAFATLLKTRSLKF